MGANVTPEQVRALNAPTDQFLCKLSDNWGEMKFRGFKIRDMISNITLIEVPDDQVENEALSDEDDPTMRLIRYHLGPDFLNLKTVGLTMYFSIGSKPINSMEMIERHYFRGKCIREFSFKFGFVIPSSTNSWEFVYDLPDLDEETRREVV